MEKKLTDAEILNVAKKIRSKYDLCDYCLGRFFRHAVENMSNKEHGETLRKKIKSKKIEVKNCFLCDRLIEEIPVFIDIIKKELKEYEFETFLIGCFVGEEILDREQEIIKNFNLEHSESIKNELNRKIGKFLERDLDRLVDFKKPDIMAVIDTVFNVINLQIASLFIYGRYKKYSREIPQTKWFCKICGGRGCKKCDYTGNIYPASVEELVSKKFLEATLSDDESFHGSGREDIDVCMLGSGRPFVLEIKNPKKRNIDLNKIKSEINKENKGVIEVESLRSSSRDEIIRIKNSKFKKTYRVVFNCENLINIEKLKKAVQSLQGSKISQFTPSRVAHRRANIVRDKYIYKCKIESVDGSMATLTLESESGTYIKELVSGDDGKTKPSISELLGVPCNTIKLDVIEIKGE